MSSTDDLNTMRNCTHYGDVLSCLCRAVLELLADKEDRANLDRAAPKAEPEQKVCMECIGTGWNPGINGRERCPFCDGPKIEPKSPSVWYTESLKQIARAESAEGCLAEEYDKRKAAEARVKALDKLTDEQNEAMKALEVELERVKAEWTRDQNNLAAALICLQSINRVHALALSNWVDYHAADGDYQRINDFLDGQEAVK